MLSAMSCLSSCVAASCDVPLLPEFPFAGIKVAEEMQQLSAADYPYLWEWVGRLNKLRLELNNQ